MPGSPTLSIVVVTYAMERELPRTLRSLSTPYQRDLHRDDYEIIVVDNGSPTAASATLPTDVRAEIHVHRIDGASPSPAHAANVGLGIARGELIGLIVDGARLASPGLLSAACLASRLAPRAVVTAPAWHLGPAIQVHAEATGYDTSEEDELLARSAWESDGYALFSVATPAASSGRGLFGPMGESSSLFLHRAMWDDLGGLDERFALPGGGLVNHDLYRRACGLPEAQLVVLLGEGTFHQIHGGAATSGRVGRVQMRADYEDIRGVPHGPPSAVPIFVGSAPRSYLPYVRESADQVLSERSLAYAEPGTSGDTRSDSAT